MSAEKRIAQHLGEVNDLSSYLAAIHSALNGEMEALFRGHRDVNWKLTPAIAMQTLAFALLMGFVGGFIPAWRAARLKIVDCLREA